MLQMQYQLNTPIVPVRNPAQLFSCTVLSQKICWLLKFQIAAASMHEVTALTDLSGPPCCGRLCCAMHTVRAEGTIS
jgi:hypothetical protein